jgi:hypothetical protein
MLKLILAAGNLGFALSSLFLGIRLLLLARRTRQLPEIFLGIGMFFGGFMGHTLAWIVYVKKPPEPWLTMVTYMYRSGATVACALVATLAWYVFRRERGDVWAKVLLASLVAVLATYIFRDSLLSPGPAREQMQKPIYWLHVLGLSVPYLWCMVESMRYQSRIRRQWNIGLPADLVLATRMRLWAVGMGSIGLMLLGLETIRLINVLHGSMLMDPRTVVGFMGLSCTISLWTAFFLPPAYVRHLKAKSEQASAA